MSPGKLLKRRYQKFRRMGEGSSFSQEAMNREVDLPMSISSETPNRPSRNGRSRRRRDGDIDVPGVADAEAAASD